MKKIIYVLVVHAVLCFCVAGVFTVYHSPMIKINTISIVESIDSGYVERDRLTPKKIKELDEYKRFVQYNENAHWNRHRFSRMVLIYGSLLSAAVSLAVAWFLARQVDGA